MNSIDRMPRTPFGAPLLDDYGQDDLSGEIFDADVALVSDNDLHMQAQIDGLLGTWTPRKREELLLIAALDLDAPAKRRRRSLHEGWSVEISRQPDFYDEGKAWWIGDFGAVGFDAEHWSKALSVCENHGFKVLRGVMPSVYGLTVVPHGEGLWNTQGFTKAESNFAYMLWSIAQSTLSN